MSRIAIDARLINSSTGTYTERLIHHLEQIDTKNEYVIIVPTKDKDFYAPRNPNFTIAMADFDAFSFAEQFGFKRFLDSLKADLVHFCMPQQPIFYSGKKVTTFHDLTLLKTYNSDINWFVFRSKQFVGRFVFKQIIRSSSYLLTPTKYVQAELERFSSHAKQKTIQTYEAAEQIASVIEPYDIPFKQFIMYVGQQPDYKNIRRLGKAHQKLLGSHPDLGLVFVGKKGDDTTANETYFAKNGFKNIHFTGFIPNAQRDWLMKHTAAYVFPSLMEGFGLPGLEAMAVGTPVVSSNATCLPEVYGDAAEYFDPNNVDDMANAIERVISDEARRNELSKLGTEQVKKYSWRRMAEQTHEVYMNALKD